MKQAMNRKKRAEELINHLKLMRDDEGYAAVDINVTGGEVFDPLGMSGQRDLSPDIYGYIDEHTKLVPANVPVKVNFHGDLDADTQKDICGAIERHYKLGCLELSTRLAGNFAKMLFLALFGAAVLTAYFLLTFATDKQVLFSEILSIIGTFSLWEAVNAFLLERPELRRELKRMSRNLCMCVRFIPAHAAAKECEIKEEKK